MVWRSNPYYAARKLAAQARQGHAALLWCFNCLMIYDSKSLLLWIIQVKFFHQAFEVRN